jgi:hypothetical protein
MGEQESKRYGADRLRSKVPRRDRHSPSQHPEKKPFFSFLSASAPACSTTYAITAQSLTGELKWTAAGIIAMMNRDQPRIPLPLDPCLNTLPLGLDRKNLLQPYLPPWGGFQPSFSEGCAWAGELEVESLVGSVYCWYKARACEMTRINRGALHDQLASCLPQNPAH